MSRPFTLLTLLGLLITSVIVQAQTPVNTESDTASQKQQAKGVIDDPHEPDSILRRTVFRFHMRPMGVKIYSISNVWHKLTGVHHHDPLTGMYGHYFLSKGIVGQSHIDLYPTLVTDLKWNYQPNTNSGYMRTPYNINFYQTRKPYSQLSYSSSLKKEYTLRVIHSQNINPRWNVALDYMLLNPEPIFSNEDTKNNYLTINTNYYSNDSRYQGYAALIWQRWNIGENGGLSDDNIFRNNAMSDFTGLPVNDYTARSLYNSWSFYSHNSYNFVNQVQRIREHFEFKVNDDDSTKLDTIIFTDTLHPAPLRIVNPGVIGFDFSRERSARRYIDSTTVFQYMMWLYWTNDAYPDSRFSSPLKVTVGIQPRWYRINEHDSLHYRWENSTITTQLALNIGCDTLATSFYYTLGNNYLRNNYHAEAHYTHRIDSIRTATLLISSISQSPDFFFFHYHSNDNAWDYPNLDKNAIQKIGLQYHRDSIFDIELTANHIDKTTWLQENGVTLAPTQNNTDFWLLQSHIALRLKLWDWLHYDMEQFLQYSSDEQQWDVPIWATKNSLFADFNLFHNVLQMQAGIDIRYHTPFYADAYNAPAGAFVKQRNIEVGNYLWGDLFINIQVRKVTIFIKGGHFNAIWESNPNYFQLPHYPSNKFGIYYGLTWRFFD